MLLQKDIRVSKAVFDDSKKYRYVLYRIWDDSKPQAVFIMLNPSTADETQDDPTIRRSIDLARTWGCGAMIAVNIFALRSTNPKGLRTVTDPVGPQNDTYIASHCVEAHRILVAWGNHGVFLERGRQVEEMLKRIGCLQKVFCFGYTMVGTPKHPLYLRKDAPIYAFTTQEIREMQTETTDAIDTGTITDVLIPRSTSCRRPVKRDICRISTTTTSTNPPH
eukprot:ANDGO_00630.mRNA.1 hypothetical protein